MHSAITALKRDVAALAKKVGPRLSVASEFKRQWKQQQERIVSTKEVELERMLRTEAAEKLRNAESSAQERSAGSAEQHRLRRIELRQAWKQDYETLVRQVFE